MYRENATPAFETDFNGVTYKPDQDPGPAPERPGPNSSRPSKTPNSKNVTKPKTTINCIA